MSPATSLAVLLAAVHAVEPPPIPGPTLSLESEPGIVRARIKGMTPDFLGAILVAETDALAHSLVDLPPLLVDHTVVGIGQANGNLLVMEFPVSVPAADLAVFVQGVTLDEHGVLSTAVEPFALTGQWVQSAAR